MGVERVLAKLRLELKDGTYRPLPARERLIPKRSGKLRSLSSSTVRDRIVQTAAKLVLEPIFEADFCPTSYGFRPERRAQDAIEQVRFFINAPRSYEWVIEGDVEDCCGSIHQGLLMEQVRRRVTDKRVLALIRLFVAAGIMREQGSLAATPSGTSQGSGLSPLLSNIALSVLDRHFEAAWTARRWYSQRARDRANGLPSYRMIRFADDFVVLVRDTETQAHAIKKQTAEFMTKQMRLTLSPEKTAITHVDDGFDLLGFRIVRRPWKGTKRVAITFPSQRALREVMHRNKTLTTRSTTNLSLDQLIQVLNPTLPGLDQLPPPRHKQPLLRLSQPLPVAESDPVAAQEARAADLDTDQATVLGAQLDQPRRHEACLARRGTSDPISLSRPQHPLAVGGHRNKPSHHSTGNRCYVTSATIGHRVLRTAGCSRMSMSGSERGSGKQTSGNTSTAPRPDPYLVIPRFACPS
jgi:RNA-directed DNA polymerase